MFGWLGWFCRFHFDISNTYRYGSDCARVFEEYFSFFLGRHSGAIRSPFGRNQNFFPILKYQLVFIAFRTKFLAAKIPSTSNLALACSLPPGKIFRPTQTVSGYAAFMKLTKCCLKHVRKCHLIPLFGEFIRGRYYRCVIRG